MSMLTDYMTKALCILILQITVPPLHYYALAETPHGLQDDKAVKNSASRPSQNRARFPVPAAQVSDFAGVIDEKTRDRLENTLKNLQRRAGINFNLVTVETTGGQDIFEFSRELARDWKLNLKSNAKKTLLLVFAVKERTLFTQFSKAAQAELSEGILGELGHRMRELMNSGQFSNSLVNGVQFFVNSLAQKIGFSLKGIDQPDTVYPTESSHSTERATETELFREKDDSPTSTFRVPLEEVTLRDNYKVGVGDILNIQILNSTTSRSTLYTVTDGGLIDFPLAGGPMAVAGLTPAEIQTRLAAELKRRALDEGAKLTVSVRQYSSHAVTVAGLVNYPGTKVLTRETVPLYVIIAEAQPGLDAGRVTIMRAGSTGPALNLKDPAALDFNIQSGDVINVIARPEEYYYIGGRIDYPGRKILQPRMTVLQAILAAGGLSRQSANKIELLREGLDGRLTTTRFDMRDQYCPNVC